MATPDPRWRRTFWINFADLSLYWGGDAFASLSTVLPLFVSRLSDSTVLVGLVPALYWIGFIGPQVLAAGYVRKLPRKKPFAIAAFGVQRASMFALAAVTFALGGGQPKALLVAFLVLYTIGCIGIGAGIPPYQDMIAKVVPVEKRGRLRGWGVFAASALGVAAGFVARQVIEGQPFPRGFAICFAIAGALPGDARAVRAAAACWKPAVQQIGTLLYVFAPSNPRPENEVRPPAGVYPPAAGDARAGVPVAGLIQLDAHRAVV